MPEVPAPQQKGKDPSWHDALETILKAMVASIQAIGMPATFLVLAVVVISWFSTPEQKHEIIDKFVLGKRVMEAWPLIVLGGLTLLFNYGNYIYGRMRVRNVKEELTRVSIEKSQLQAMLSERLLKHSSTDLED
jgi:hypothetical protein